MKMFKSAYLKLTIYYVTIVMFLSIVFSVAIYQISSNEINRGLGRGIRSFGELPQQSFSGLLPNQNIQKIIDLQLQESQAKLKTKLIYLNILILIIFSLGSYFLAKKTLKPVEEMVESQNRFTADASHELKTPLAVMQAEIEVGLRDNKFNFENAKKLLESNLEEITKLELLSNTLLNLARYQEQVKLDFSEISLEEIIVEAFEKVENKAKNKQIVFKNKLENILINGNRQSLVELFVILIDNAIKYSPKKSEIKINITQEKNKAMISIKDHGSGIKASDLPYIFNRFYRADQSRNKEKADGYGLGLSIAKEIVDLHNGEIKVASNIGKGSEFSVVFRK